MTTKIISNYHWHNFLYGYELPESVRADFDYIDDLDYPTHDFIKYRGIYYDAADFMTTCYADKPLSDWDGYQSDSFFSGVLIRISKDCEQYQIATYIS